MPIGLLSAQEFDAEIESLTTQKTEKESHVEYARVQEESHGRGKGDVNVPDSLRKIIGETQVIDGRQAALKLANQFGISPSSVSAYANGATSTTTYATPSKSIISHINKSRQRAIGKASKTLNGALSAITQEKLDYSDAKDLATIAKDMSVVIKNLEPEKVVNESTDVKQPQFVIFAPQFRQESTFEVIDVKE